MDNDIKLLNISDRIFKKYKRTIKGNDDLDIITVRKKLTRNFLLGQDVHSDYNYKYVTRKFGKLYIQVNMKDMEVIDIQNRKSKNRINMFINPVEKDRLNKLFKIE